MYIAGINICAKVLEPQSLNLYDHHLWLQVS